MEEEVEIKRKKSRHRSWGVYLGCIFIIIGVLWLAVALGIIPRSYLKFWPQILLIIIGLLFIIKSIWR